MTAKRTPILANDGRTIIGFASTQAGAIRFLKKNIGDHSLYLINHCKFNLQVWMREEWITELNGGPVGWMYSIGK